MSHLINEGKNHSFSNSIIIFCIASRSKQWIIWRVLI